MKTRKRIPRSTAKAETGAAQAGVAGRLRRCAATGETLHESGLIRFVLGPLGEVVPDVAAKLPGRGAWVSATRACVDQAQAKGVFARAFKSPAKSSVRAGADLADQTEALLARRCLDLLGLLRRSGALVLGQSQVEAAIRAKPAYILIEAADGAEDGREKLARLHFGLWSRPATVAACFSSSELGMALGRDRVIHACLLQERPARAWAVEIGRLAGFRPIVPTSWPDSWRSLGLGLDGADSEISGSGVAPGTHALDKAVFNRDAS
jgi:predicted RNA-binding protein YlxR (DUF448 family)